MTEARSNSTELVAVILDAIERTAPDVDAHAMARDVDIRVEADLDSMDFLAVVTALSEQTGVDIPEADYGQVRSIDDLEAYLAQRTGSTEPGPADRH